VFYDQNKLIVQQDGDGGDTAGREGDYWVMHALTRIAVLERPTFSEVLEKLQVAPGTYVRNPEKYNAPNDFSRDQTVPLIVAMGLHREYGHLQKLMKEQLKRATFYQNGDMALPQDWGYYIRAFRFWPLYPVLMLGDAFLFLNSIFRCLGGLRNADDVSDDINHTIALLQAQESLPTPISWLARKFYVFFRPGGVQAAWDHYFRPSTGANPFHELFRPLIEKL